MNNFFERAKQIPVLNRTKKTANDKDSSGEIIYDLIAFDRINQYLDNSNKITEETIRKRVNIVPEMHENRRKDWNTFLLHAQELINI